MQISFDPTNPAELAAARKMLDGLAHEAPLHPKLQKAVDAINARDALPMTTTGFDVADVLAAAGAVPEFAKNTSAAAAHYHAAQSAAAAGESAEKAREAAQRAAGNWAADHADEAVVPRDAAVNLTPAQVEAMDETAGIAPQRAVPPPPVPAPSTAAATALTSAPEEPQDGAALDPSVFGQPAATDIAPAVLTAPAAPASPAPAGDRAGLDRDGLPWDERIHSGGENAKNKDGTWRQRRNLPDGLRAQVEAELRGHASLVEPVSSSAAAEPATHPQTQDSVAGAIAGDSVAAQLVASTAAPAASAIPLPPVPQPPRPPAPPADPAAPPVPSPPAIPSSTPPAAAPATASGIAPATDLITLLHKVTTLTEQRILDIDEVNDMVKARGVDGLMFMAAVPADKLGALVAEIDAAIEEKFA